MSRIFAALVAAMLVYELVALVDGHPGDTISEIIWTLTANYPLVPFALGMLMGHFFWQRHP